MYISFTSDKVFFPMILQCQLRVLFSVFKAFNISSLGSINISTEYHEDSNNNTYYDNQGSMWYHSRWLQIKSVFMIRKSYETTHVHNYM